MNKDFFEARTTKELCRLLGVSEKEAIRIEMRRNLVIAIKRVIKKNQWTHEEVARKTGFGRTVITAIVNGNLKRISTDRLMDVAQNLGLSMKLKVVA